MGRCSPEGERYKSGNKTAQQTKKFSHTRLLCRDKI
jgi:hypothetical protein